MKNIKYVLQPALVQRYVMRVLAKFGQAAAGGTLHIWPASASAAIVHRSGTW